MAVSWWLLVALAVVVTVVNAQSNPQYGTALPGKSCRDIYQLNPSTHGKSGYYAIKVGDRPEFVYCDMELECGGEKGWMKVTSVDVAKGDDCPNGWTKVTSPAAACRAPSDNAGCYSAQFSTHQVPYSRVCGMMIGYQKGRPNAFQTKAFSIDGPYVDGVSITYSTPRKHIWTYAIGFNEVQSEHCCPCTIARGHLPPSFVHENYYCESGSSSTNPKDTSYWTTDPVWDGKGCPNKNSCCSEPNLPWFYRQIPLTTEKLLEARICRDESFSNEGVLVKEIKLYVQ